MRISDWSSDVCSSDLPEDIGQFVDPAGPRPRPVGLPTANRGNANRHQVRQFALRHRLREAKSHHPRTEADRKSVVEGKSVEVRVDLGGRRIIKKKNIKM